MIDAKSLIEMLESSYDGIWITDGNGRILFANSANASLLGVTKEDLMGKSTEELLEKKIFSDSVCLEAIEQKRQTSKVCYNYNTQLTVLATATPIFGENGEVRYIFNNVRDITSLNNMQASLRDKEEIIRRQNKQLEDMKIRLGVGTIIANSESFRKVVELAQRVATFDGATVLILGESGTGKELVAESLHSEGGRAGPFVSQNCAAIPATLLESLFFGTEKGSYTGALTRKGLLEEADGGTLFLDEINSMDPALQAKLLKVLEEKKVRRLGGSRDIPFDVRIVAAVNEKPQKLIREGRLREDLYYRLGVIRLTLPPLRERLCDIGPLADYFIEHYNRKLHRRVRGLSERALRLLRGYAWPGNVRELKNAIEGAVAVARGERLTVEDMEEILAGRLGGLNRPPELPEALRLEESFSLTRALDSYERELLSRAMQQAGSISQAARLLGLSRQNLKYKLKKFDL